MDNYLTSANVWAIVWALIGILLTVGSSMLTARSLFPSFARRCAVSAGRPWISGLIGAAVAGATILLLGVLQKFGTPGQIPMFILGSAVFLLAIAGASGLLVRMARNSAANGEDPESWLALRRSATVLTITFLLPVAGTFVALPAVLLCGLGCAVRNLFSSERSPAPAALPVTISPPPVMPPLPSSAIPSGSYSSVQS